MQSISVNEFRDHLKQYADTVTSQHTPLMVTRRNGADFVVMSAEDWQREQETLYVLQNQKLMQQIAKSYATHSLQKGRAITQEEQDEIDHI